MKGDYWEDGAIASEGNGVDGDDDDELMKEANQRLRWGWEPCGVTVGCGEKGFACFKSRIGFVGRISCGVVRGLEDGLLRGVLPFPLWTLFPPGEARYSTTNPHRYWPDLGAAPSNLNNAKQQQRVVST